MALRITRSASDSSRSISSQVFSAASAVAGIGDLVQQLDRVFQALAALDAQVRQAGDLVRHVTHVVQRHGLGGVLDQVGHVVHGVDQLVDQVTVDRRDERLVQHLVDVMRHAVGGALGIVNIAVVLLAQVRVVVVGHQLRESPRRLDDAVSVLVEQFEKIAFARHQLAKQHRFAPGGVSNM
jgi:hypothetical protein